MLALEAFGRSIATEPRELAHIVVAHRRLGVRAALQPLPPRAAIGPPLREGVVGLGVAQMIEWTFQRGARDLIGKIGTARFRMMCCSTALARAKTWQLEIGRDHEQNWNAVAPLLR